MKKSKKKQNKPLVFPTPENLENHYDDEINTPTINFDNPKELKFLEKQFIKHCKITLDSLEGEGDRRRLLEYFDFTKHYLRKKRQTYLAYVQTASEKFKSKYPDLFIENMFSVINASPLESYNMYASLFHIDYAAALWILDELTVAGKLGTALQYLPEESDIDFSEHSYYDASHDSDVIESLLFLIKNRNSTDLDEERYFTSQTELELIGRREYTVPAETDDLTYRERFNAIMALIPEERIEQAVSHFKDHAWDTFDVVLDCVNFYRHQEIRLLKKLKRITEDLKETRANKLQSLSQNIPFKNNIANHFDGFASDRENLEYMRKVDEAAETETKSNEYGLHVDTLTVLGSSIKFRIEMIDTYADTEIGKKLMDLEVDNPYECCFAALYMLDSGDDFAWLYGLCLSVLQTAIFQLPWGRVANVAQLISEEDYQKSHETGSNNTDEENSSEQSEESTVKSKPDFTEPQEFYSNQYKKVLEDKSIFKIIDCGEPEILSKINFPQLVFEETSVIMPRASTLVSRKSFYEKAGSSDDIYKYYLNLLQSSHIRDNESIAFSDDNYYEEDYIEDNLIESSIEEAIAEEKDAFKKQKDEFRRKLNASHQERNELKREIRSLKQTNEKLEKEIQELRSMIRERDYFDSTESKESAIKPVAFPYETKHRFVVFGGHASWAKAIKPLLKNVRFVDAYAKPNPDLILHADTVWLQSNAIGHSSYYKIMNLVREHGVPLQYFEAASAEKCAEQLALYDMSLS
ncbi:MAG: hypothetical protein K6F88_03975 [Ruminococcus sp.]|nr:hypothetical protein [Ruminococcus sp.]